MGMGMMNIIQVMAEGKDQAKCLPEQVKMHQQVAGDTQEEMLQHQPEPQVQEEVQEVMQVIA
jgi:hypothetical protein